MNAKKYVGIALLSAALVLGGCGKNVTPSTTAPLVKTMVVGEGVGEEKRTFSGTVHGYFEAPLAFQTGGRVVARYVQQGQRVSAGDVLMKVDSKDAEEQLASAQSALAAAQAKMELASSTRARYDQLHGTGAISDLAMDQVNNEASLARANLNSAEATVQRASNNLSFTTLTADRSGVVGSTLIEVGQVVAAGTPVLSIIDDSKKDVYISLTEKQMHSYSVGMKAKVTFWALPSVTAEGVIREIGGAPNTSTGTYDAKVTLLDPPDSVVVGMTAEVKFTENTTKGFMVPLSAMATQSEKPSLWVVRDRKVTLVPVTVGRYGEDNVEITGGLSRGDRIVTAGASKLTEGEEVRT